MTTYVSLQPPWVDREGNQLGILKVDSPRDEIRRGLGRAVRRVLDRQALNEPQAAGAGGQDHEFRPCSPAGAGSCRRRRRIQQRRHSLEQQQRRDGVDGEMLCHLARGRDPRAAEVL